MRNNDFTRTRPTGSLQEGGKRMHRLQLKHYLEAAGVPEDRYLLVGVDPPRPVSEGACILRPNQRSWEVLVWRPVPLRPSLTFLTEQEACEYVLDALTAQPVAGARGPEAGRSETAKAAEAAPAGGRRPADLAASDGHAALEERAVAAL